MTNTILPKRKGRRNLVTGTKTGFWFNEGPRSTNAAWLPCRALTLAPLEKLQFAPATALQKRKRLQTGPLQFYGELRSVDPYKSGAFVRVNRNTVPA